MSENTQYKYYSTQRPVDIGTFPKTEGGPCRIENFDKRIPVENGQFVAWGYLEYTYPLTKRQIDDYELRPAPDNLTLWKKVNEQTQTVGKWEKSHRINEVTRLTWDNNGQFYIKPFISPERMAQRYGEVMETKARAAEKRAAAKPIAEQLAEAKKQAERGADVPAKKHNKSHEDR